MAKKTPTPAALRREIAALSAANAELREENQRLARELRDVHAATRAQIIELEVGLDVALETGDFWRERYERCLTAGRMRREGVPFT